MKTEICHYSGFKIWPGHGIHFIRQDNKSFVFASRKIRSLFHQKKNPRRLAWTVFYRRLHRKGLTEVTTKKKSKRTTKAPKAIVGATLVELKAKREQKPDLRAEQRAAAAKAVKDKAKAAKAAAAAVKTKQAPKQAAPKQAVPKVSKAGKGR